MITKYMKEIKNLLKAYHKKYDCFGNKLKQTKRKKQ